MENDEYVTMLKSEQLIAHYIITYTINLFVCMCEN